MNQALDRGLDQYQLALPGFEGPLDVLLRLIERDQLPVTSISIVTVTGQFLEHFADMPEASPAAIAEFSAVAARLLVLKSRALIPRPEPNPPDFEVDLVQQLREHQAIRQAAVLLRALDRQDSALFPVNQVSRLSTGQRNTRLGMHEPGLLTRALFRRLATLPARVIDKRVIPVVSLQQMILRVIEHVSSGRCSLYQILGQQPTRDEEIAGFLALLVLIRRHMVAASQQSRFGEIVVEQLPHAAPVLSAPTDPFTAES